MVYSSQDEDFENCTEEKEAKHKEDSDTETEIELVDLKPHVSNPQEGDT